MKTGTLVSVEEYFINEAKAQFKSEYHAGEIVAMAGARISHNQIVANLIMRLGNCVLEKDCIVLPSDILLELPECQKFVYADVVIVCGKVKLGNRQGIDVLQNPTVIIEVLSESTERYDRGEKFRCYKTLASMQQYILVSSEEVLVESFERTPDNFWLLKTEEKEEKSMKIGDCDIFLKDIYNKVGFEIKNRQ
jgi:Uma2 family endonuclease